MKLLHYGWSHPRNQDSIMISCIKFNIEYEYTDVLDRIHTYDYDILWLPCNWISPDSLPEHIKIIYGPHFCVFPSVDMPIVGPLQEEWKSRCFFTTLSDWNTKIYIDFVESFKVPILALPFGLDTDKFCPDNSEKIYDFLLVFKGRNRNELQYSIDVLQSMNMSFNILMWGSFQHEEYLDLLRKSKGVLWIGSHESQGFAVQEALSCNIPLLVWNVKSLFQEVNPQGIPEYRDYIGKKDLIATTVTSWDSICGEVFYEAEELIDTLQIFVNKLTTYSPRKFVLKNLTHEICFGNMLKKLNIQLEAS